MMLPPTRSSVPFFCDILPTVFTSSFSQNYVKSELRIGLFLSLMQAVSRLAWRFVNHQSIHHRNWTNPTHRLSQPLEQVPSSSIAQAVPPVPKKRNTLHAIGSKIKFGNLPLRRDSRIHPGGERRDNSKMLRVSAESTSTPEKCARSRMSSWTNQRRLSHDQGGTGNPRQW